MIIHLFTFLELLVIIHTFSEVNGLLLLIAKKSKKSFHGKTFEALLHQVLFEHLSCPLSNPNVFNKCFQGRETSLSFLFLRKTSLN